MIYIFSTEASRKCGSRLDCLARIMVCWLKSKEKGVELLLFPCLLVKCQSINHGVTMAAILSNTYLEGSHMEINETECGVNMFRIGFLIYCHNVGVAEVL